MSQPNLNDRQRAFVLIALLADREGVTEYLPFLSPEDEAPVASVLKILLEKTKAEKKQVILDEIKRLAAESQMSFLPEIHPDWLLEALAKETPRTIATVLRHLPGQHVKYLLEHLPEAIVQKLPSLSETFALNPELAFELRKKFEAGFALMPRSSPIPRGLSFDNLHCLPAETLIKLFREIGFREIALAFRTLKPQAIDLIVKRFPHRDAALLKLKIEQNEAVLEERLKKAQSHLMGLNLEKGNPGTFIMESGFDVYSKGVLQVHLHGARVIQQKLSKSLGMLLKRALEKNIPLNSENTVGSYQNEIVAVARKMGAGEDATARK